MTNDKFEYLAEQFYRKTKVLAPGKDDCLNSHSAPVRRQFWYIFLAERELDINSTGVKLGATHWAEAPDFEIIYFTIGDDLQVWLPLSNIWGNTSSAPYTLIEVKEE